MNLEATFDVRQPHAVVAARDERLLARAKPGVAHADPQRVAGSRRGAIAGRNPRRDHDLSARTRRRDAMLDRILYQRLDEQRGNTMVSHLAWRVNRHMQPVFEPRSLDVQV